MEWQVEYYKKENGDIPVLDYLLSLYAKIIICIVLRFVLC